MTRVSAERFAELFDSQSRYDYFLTHRDLPPKPLEGYLWLAGSVVEVKWARMKADSNTELLLWNSLRAVYDRAVNDVVQECTQYRRVRPAVGSVAVSTECEVEAAALAEALIRPHELVSLERLVVDQLPVGAGSEYVYSPLLCDPAWVERWSVALRVAQYDRNRAEEAAGGKAL